MMAEPNRWSLRRRCLSCGHGYGVHSRVKQPLVIADSRVGFYESQRDAPDQCTAGSRFEDCSCRLFWEHSEDTSDRHLAVWSHLRKTHHMRASDYRMKWTTSHIEAMHDVEHSNKRLRHDRENV